MVPIVLLIGIVFTLNGSIIIILSLALALLLLLSYTAHFPYHTMLADEQDDDNLPCPFGGCHWYVDFLDAPSKDRILHLWSFNFANGAQADRNIAQ